MGNWNLYRPISLMLGICLTVLCASVAAADAPSPELTLADLRHQFALPEQQIDYAQAKLTVDRLIDPSTDTVAVLRGLDQLTATVKQRTPAGLTKRAELDVLLDTLYKPGPWNGNKPFSYDLNDPFGKNRKNKLLASYLTTRKGNCVTMPILVAILGQRLGLIMALATAPEHVMVKFVDDEGRWLNVEATAGGFKADSSYERETGISSLAIQNEIYLRPLSPWESVGIMASTLMEEYAAEKRGDDLLAVAEMVLAINPTDTVAMIHKANAYYLQLQTGYVSKYLRPVDIPQAKQADFRRLSRENLAWFSKAEQLGWTPKTLEQEEKYLQSIQREKERGEP